MRTRATIKGVWPRIVEWDREAHSRWSERHPRLLASTDSASEWLFDILSHNAFNVICALVVSVLLVTGTIDRTVVGSLALAWLIAILWFARSASIKKLTIPTKLIALLAFSGILAVLTGKLGKWSIAEYHRNQTTTIHQSTQPVYPASKPIPEPSIQLARPPSEAIFKPKVISKPEPYPWISFQPVGETVGESTKLVFVNLQLIVQEYPTGSHRDLAVLASLDNVHVSIKAHLFVKPTEAGSQGMTCTVAEMRALQWNNDNAVNQPIARIRLRPDATVLDVMVSARNGFWNGNTVLFNRGNGRVEGDQYIGGRFADSSKPSMLARRITDGTHSSQITYNAKPLILSHSLINQDPLAPTYSGDRLYAACADFIYK